MTVKDRVHCTKKGCVMLHFIKKEFFLSLLISVATGLLTFFLLHLPMEQSLVLSLITGLLFFLYLYRDTQDPVIVENFEKSTAFNEEYRLLEKKFKAVSEKADKLEIEKQTTELFLASMSHEIRTPLNGIIGLTEVLDDTVLTTDQKEFVSMIRESSNNLRVIVNDILDVSKMNAGKMQLESIPFNLSLKIAASAGIFAPKIEEKNISLSVDTDARIPKELVGDPTRLSQVITNLVSNALKFTERGGKIDVLAEYIEQNRDKVTFKVAVRDTGIGMTKAQQEKVFEAYSQATLSTTRKSGGTGLGLMISTKIINSMGGELKVESEEGKGSTFFFIITLKSAETIVEEIPAVDGSSVEVTTTEIPVPVLEKVSVIQEEVDKVVSPTKKVLNKTFEDLRVLVAEDNPINQKLIKIVLERLGLHVTLTSNGEEACEARINGDFDMVFMDIQMPVMGGVEATHSILAYEKENALPHIPIIALTANALPGDKEKYMREGMDDYATKPLDVKMLEKLIEKYCNIQI